jgi:acyl-CoA hydrolase/RimJ/RimL family protein N-acetyltransferase
VSAPEAIKQLKPGWRVFIGSACGEPQALVRALVESGGGLADTELVQVLTLGVAPYTDPRYAETFRANAFFIGNSVRDAVNQARADYTPIFLSQVPGLFRSRRVDIDAALVMVSPPDAFGFASLGVSVDITKAAVESARMVIAQVNRHMPQTHGDTFVHVKDIDFLVECDEPLLEWPMTEPDDDATERIASHITPLIPDGATLQLGIGKLPDAVLSHLENKNDLGIHTEMYSDGVMKLAQRGVITGRRKTHHKGKIVGSFAAGTRELFEFLDNNPQIEMHPSDYTNSAFVIARHDDMIAINSALEVDLTGQVCADSLGEHLYSGIGGHADFIRGTALAKNGKPIIALPSTAKTQDGVRSRIVADLQVGAGVVTTRGDVHYVVTEQGVAYLHGRTMRERAMALIGVAHPDFRSELLHQAKRRRIVYLDQILPPPRAPYPAEYESTMTLDDGTGVLVRPIRPEDEPLMKDMFYSFSEQTVHLRFHSHVRAMPHQRLQVFCNIDYDTEMALVGLIDVDGREEVVGVGSFVQEASGGTAEVAFMVRDEWQGKGLGSYLFRRLVDIARTKGVPQFQAYVLPENTAMLKVFHGSGLETETKTEDGVVAVTMRL